MQLHIRHETLYSYGAPASYSIQRLHLTPPSFASQRVIAWRIAAPGIENALVYRDGFGNMVHVVTTRGSHDRVSVVAEGTVEVDDVGGMVRGLPTGVPEAVYLRQTPATQPDAAMRALATEAAQQGVSILERLHWLLAIVHARIAYATGTTHARTTAAEALAQSQGVCQDHAHVFLGICRHMRVPCRFVTGYLATGAGASSSAGHAWVEALVPDLGWVGFDAANGQCPTGEYVRMAAGLDAAMVTPVQGSRRGGEVESMDVGVSVAMTEQ